ncbi:MAG: NAD(P)H-binding protein [Lactobacillales bacterium]|jgi:putative NADH-flavin reductase|nr:NAD(P)H-binding protein [Lactobacillales bacterium]
MNIALIGASGNAGKHILNELLTRNLSTTAIVRHASKITEDIPVIEKDLFDLTTDDLAPFDVVIDAFNAPRGKEEMHVTSLQHLINLLTDTQKRLIVVGGASSLFTDKNKNIRFIDNVDPTSPFYPTAHEMFLALQDLKKTPIAWTYISPAAFFDPDGRRTGSYELFDDEMHDNHAGKSYVSMADYAIALVDEVVNAAHVREHISVVSEK